MGKQNKQSLLQGALILSVAALLTKVIGALLFKIPLQRLDEQAYGYFLTAFNIYVPIYTVSTAGFPIAVSRMVSESITLGRYRDVRVILRVANRVFLITGLAGTGVMIISAFIYPYYVNVPNAILTMLVMAPSIYFCCMVTAYRGVYEGSRNMVPTAVSQIVEAVGKMLFGITAAYGLYAYGQKRFEQGHTVFGKIAGSAEEALDISRPYIAAGAMLGVTLGSLFALLYIVFHYRRNGSGITREELAGAPKSSSNRHIFRSLVAFAIPVALGTLATQVTSLVDVTSLQKSLSIVIGKSGDVVWSMYTNWIDTSKVTDLSAFLYGTNGVAMTYVNLIPNITLSLGISALPVITAAWAEKDRLKLKNTVNMVLRVTLLMSMPAGIGLSVLARPLMNLIYTSDAAVNISGSQLQVLGIATIFICLVAPINAMLQAMGRADVPMKIVLIGGAVKLFLNIVLVMNPRINIMGSAYSTLVCYVVMIVLSLRKLSKIVNIRIKWRTLFVKPLIASLACGGTAWIVNKVLSALISPRLATVIAIVPAAFIYAFLLFKLRALNKDDILMLPKGQKIAQILEKRGWIG